MQASQRFIRSCRGWHLKAQEIFGISAFYDINGGMTDSGSSYSCEQRLREIATHLRDAFCIVEDHDVTLSDLTLALDSPDLTAIMLEIRALHEEELQRLERLLSRMAANDR